jgi:hypothetical protein
MPERNDWKELTEDVTSLSEEELHAVAKRIRETMGEDYWKSLQRLSKMFGISAFFITLSLLYIFLTLLRLGISWLLTQLGRDQQLESEAGIIIAIVVLVCFGAGIGMWIITRTINSKLELLPPTISSDMAWMALNAKDIFRRQREQAQEEEEERAYQQRLHESDEIYPWWMVELSGAHLVWWISFALTISYLGTWVELPASLINCCAVLAITGVLLKVFIPFFMITNLYHNHNTLNQRRYFAITYYRWWGRWVSIIVALLPVGAYWVAIKLWY